MSINVVQQLVNTTGLEIIPHPLFNPEHKGIGESLSDIVIAAVPVSSYNPEHVEESHEKKRRRRKSSELQEERIRKDFSLPEIFKTNDIKEINLVKENKAATLDSQKLQQNLQGWIIRKRRRVGIGYERNDQFYNHDKISTSTLRSLVQVKRCIEEHSYLEKDSENNEGHEGPKVDLVDVESMQHKTSNGVENYGRVDELVKDNKLSRKPRPVTCSKCHNQGHNSRTCKGQLAT